MNTLFHYVRVAASTMQTLHAFSTIFTTHTPHTLLLLGVAGSISEICNRLGTLWYLRGDRTLPLWPVLSPLKPVSRWLLRNQMANQLLVSFLLVCLALCLLVPEIALPLAVPSFWLLCLLDGWRLVYSHYWLGSLTALLFSSAPVCTPP